VKSIAVLPRLSALYLGLAFLLWTAVTDANQITGLKGPHSFLADPSGEQYFISNTNGEPEAKTNHGFITRVDPAGKITELKFIQGGRQNVILHAPKGMALIAQTLYVTDLDTLRGFDKSTGRPLVNVSFTSHERAGRPVSLIDVAQDDRGGLYLSDTEANTIYYVDIKKQHAVSVLVHDSLLAGPRGLAIHPKTGHLIVASWNTGKIFEVTPDGKITEMVSNGFFSHRFNNLDGLDFDSYGNLYISDFTGGKIWRMRPNQKFEVIAEFLPTPADISVDRKNHLILVPYEYSNAAEMNGLEAPVTAGNKKKRDLSDYGLGWTKGSPEQK
jgi:sugar lactone lactonase YvrE